MTPFLFSLICLGLALAPGFTIVLSGLLIHHGIWSVEWAIPTLWSGATLRYFTYEIRKRKEKTNFLRPLLLLPYTTALLLLGLYVTHGVHKVLPAFARGLFGFALLAVAFIWLADLGSRLPRFIGKGFDRLPRPSALPRGARRLGAALLVIPFWPAHPVDLEAQLDHAFQGLGLTPDLRALRVSGERPRGLRAILSAKRVLVPARRADEKSDIYLARVMFDHEGRPSRVTGIFNLTETASVDESDLNLEGRWATWTIRSGEQIQSIELLDLGGEKVPSGPGWSFLGKIQRRIENLQRTGQFRGVGRSTIAWPEAGPRVVTRIDRGVLHFDTEAERFAWPLGREPDEQFSEAGLVVRELVPPRPGSLTTWTVDRLRQVSFIGSDGMQWLKGVAYLAMGELEDLHAHVVGVNAEETISEELGEVIERLPIAKPSDIPGFPPAPLKPTLNPPLPSEGEWIDLGRDVLSGGQEPGEGALVFTFIRVDPKRTYNQVSIALWDPRRIELHIVSGTEEPQSTLGRQGKGLIPREPKVLEHLIGAFNGAFQAVHGEFGMMEDSVVILPPKPFAATVATFADGSTGFGTWPAESAKIPSDMVGLRQNMTPLVAASKPNPYARHWWGGVPEGWTQETRTVRSALCVTENHHIAYLYSPSIDPDRLASAMLSARCKHGMHLDMNAGHAGFELYRVARTEALPSLGRPLDPAWEATGKVSGIEGYNFLARLLVKKMPLMNFPRYIHETPRDFFYLTRRDTLPGPPLQLPGEGEPRSFGPIATAKNDYPYFAVSAGAPEKSAAGSIIRLNPQRLSTQGDEAARGVWFPGAASNAKSLSSDPKRALVFAKGQFAMTRDPTEDALVLSFESTREQANADLYCLERSGFLNLIEDGAKPAAGELARALDCVETLTIEARDRPKFEADKAGTWLPLFVTEAPAVREIFPETPIVAPSVWGIPQAKRVNWGPEFERPRKDTP